MDKLKQWIALTVVGVLGIMAGGWFMLTSPKKAEATELQEAASAQEATNEATRNEIKSLKAQAKELPKAQARLAAVNVKIPSNPALPGLIRALTKAADGTGVTFVSLAPSAPVAVTDGSATAAVAAAPAAGATTTTTASVTRQLMAIPVTINVVGSYVEVQAYLNALESLPRATRLSNITVAPGVDASAEPDPGAESDGSSLLNVITGQVFMTAPAAAPATPVAAAAGSTTTAAGAAPAAK